MANTRISQLPVATSIDGTELVVVDQSDGAGGYVTRRTTVQAISDWTDGNTGVAAGTYGDATHVGQFTVDAAGKITYAANVAINVSSGTVTSVGLSAPADFNVTGSPVTSSGTLALAWATTPTGTGAVVRATSPTLTSPTLGNATATTINKVTVTAPATGSTLTIGDGFTLTVSGNANVSGTNTGDQTITLTGDVTGSGTGSFAATIANNAVTLAKMATVTTASFLGRTTAGTGNVEALTATQATALLNNVVGDSGAGGTKGLVPAPAAGDAAANKYLKADGTWASPAGAGTVTSVSVVSANGFAGSVATATSTPAITLSTTITGILSGNGTAISAASTTGTGAVVLASDAAMTNPTANNFISTSTSTVSSAGTTTLTSTSTRSQTLTGTNTHTFKLPDATTLTVGMNFYFNNNSSQTLTVIDASSTTVLTIPAGGATQVSLLSNSSAAGTWDGHASAPITVTWGSGVTGLVFNTALSTSPMIAAGASSSTAPSFIPQRGTSNTGLGGDATHLYGIIGGVAGWTSDASSITIGRAGSALGSLLLSGNTSGTTTLQPAAAASGTLTLPAATDTLVGKATTDVLTNKTFDTAGTGNVFKINGTTITANTGTGSNVLATSPTIVTPTIAKIANLTSNGLVTTSGGDGTLSVTSLGTNVATWLSTPSSANLAAAVTDETGSGSLVFATSPSLTTPSLGVATATSINKVAITAPATSATLTIADGKTLTANRSLTLTGTDSTTMTFPSTSATIARTDAAQTFTGVQTFSNQIVATGSIKNMVIAEFTPLQNQPPASNYATLSTRNSHAILQFDTTTQEAATFTCIMPYTYAANDIRITIWATLATATTGTLGWDVAFENMNGQDIDSDGYAAAVTVTATTVPGTSGVPLVQQVTLTQSQADSPAAGDALRIRLRRDVGSDTAAGDAELLCMIVEMV